MKKLFLVCLMFLTINLFAAPPAVETLIETMLADRVDLRAGSTEKLGVFIVAIGEAEITGKPAVARETARTLAIRNLASFLNTRITSKEKAFSQYTSDGETSEVREYLESLTEVSIDQLLKGVQTARMYVEDDTQYVIVYSTARGIDKTAEYQAAVDAMGDSGTVSAIGEASNRDAALQKALRSAVEQVLGTVVINQSAVKNFEQVKNKIFSGAEGLVDEYRITDEAQTEEMLVRVTIIAKVSKKKLHDSYSVYMKSLGDPGFFIESSSPDLESHFVDFFVDLGIRITQNPEEATYIIRCYGEFRDVVHPASRRNGKQLSLRFRVHEINGKEALIDMKNNPRKSACFIGQDPDRQSEICAEKAFKQMKKPLHEKIQAMVGRLVERHTDELMRDDE